MFKKSSILENNIVTITKATYGDDAYFPDHFHDRTAISFVLEGNINETVNNVDTLGGIANVIIKPAKTIHRDVYANCCSIICIYLNNQSELNSSAQDVFKDWGWIQSVDNYYFLEKILQSKNEKEQLKGLEDFANYYRDKKSQINFKTPPEWLNELKRILDTSYNESLKSAELAKEFNIHPVYMARVFNAYYGQSIKSYINVLKTNGAMASMLNEEVKLAQVAYENGYSDQSHLNRKFKNFTGLTPNQFKSLTK